MRGRQLRTIETIIEWAAAPVSPLPPVRETDAVAAFARSVQAGPRSHRIALGLVLAGLGLGHRESGAVLSRLETGRLATLVELLAGLAQLAYYGDAGVLGVLGYPGAPA